MSFVSLRTYRIAFERNIFENMTYAQIALDLGVSSKTIDYRITQTLKIILRELKDVYNLSAL